MEVTNHQRLFVSEYQLLAWGIWWGVRQVNSVEGLFPSPPAYVASQEDLAGHCAKRDADVDGLFL